MLTPIQWWPAKSISGTQISSLSFQELCLCAGLLPKNPFYALQSFGKLTENCGVMATLSFKSTQLPEEEQGLLNFFWLGDYGQDSNTACFFIQFHHYCVPFILNGTKVHVRIYSLKQSLQKQTIWKWHICLRIREWLNKTHFVDEGSGSY